MHTKSAERISELKIEEKREAVFHESEHPKKAKNYFIVGSKRDLNNSKFFSLSLSICIYSIAALVHYIRQAALVVVSLSSFTE